jgi:hypothetical protein
MGRSHDWTGPRAEKKWGGKRKREVGPVSRRNEDSAQGRIWLQKNLLNLQKHIQILNCFEFEFGMNSNH